MALARGLLQNRTAAVVVALILSVVAVQSWLGIAKPVQPPRRSPVELFGLAFSIYFTAWISYRSRRLRWDRIAFGCATAALALATMIAVFSVAAPTASVILVAKSLLWTAAAGGSLIALVRNLAIRRAKE